MTAELAALVAGWRHTAEQVLELSQSLDPEDFARPTDLPGWDVQDVLAHLAAIEADLAGLTPGPQPGDARDTGPARTEGPAGPVDPFTAYTEAGVRARRGRRPQEVLDELTAAVRARAAQLAEAPPAEPTGTPPRTPGRIGWDWRTLLRNRVVDVWMHEQDIRRAVGRPGDLDGPGAHVTLGSFAASMPYVVGKRVAPPPGTTVVLRVHGPVAFAGAVRVGVDGRAALLPEVPDGADAVLSMSGEVFAVLCGGRRRPEVAEIEVTGDADLARAVAASMSVTP
ncbi:MAG TPA: maleylpyruvate isomerase family mycothiol-dependent enzyme [Jiangellales bacterium]|nr:maleylpyruvate isomerase family mycothiol-dependent enzyme [Jiangellales bacterium]